MSGSVRSGASGSVRSGAGSVRLGAATAAAARHESVLDALYDRKRDNKSVRVLTVIVYVFCVSLAAIMLSLYYVFFWEPKDAQHAQRKVALTVDQQTSTTPMPTCFMPYTGGSNYTMNTEEPQELSESAAANFTYPPDVRGEDSDTASSAGPPDNETGPTPPPPLSDSSSYTTNEVKHNTTDSIT